MTVSEPLPGATFIYHAKVTNDSDGSGAISFLVEPQAGSEFEILSIKMINGDTVARAVDAQIRFATTPLDHLIAGSTAGGSYRVWPNDGALGDDLGSGPGRRIVSGDMRLYCAVGAVAVSQDATCALVLRLYGEVPVITETGQGTTPTITINAERME